MRERRRRRGQRRWGGSAGPGEAKALRAEMGMLHRARIYQKKLIPGVHINSVLLRAWGIPSGRLSAAEETIEDGSTLHFVCLEWR